jgi:TonB family protein
MIRERVLLAAAFLSAVLVCGLPAGDGESYFDSLMQGPTQWEMKLRVMEGLREGAGDPARAVTASYAGSMTTIGYLSDADLSREQEQIRKTFNLREVRLLTEADLVWDEGKDRKTSHTFRLDGWEYIIKVTPGGEERWQPFGIEVFEKTEKGETSLLDTGFALPKKMNKPIVFGFENGQGRPFFVCLHAVSPKAGKIEGLVVEAFQPVAAAEAVGQAASMAAEKKKRLVEFEKGATLVREGVPAPKLIKSVAPVYPEEARKNGIQGVVILEAKADESGRVVDTMVLKSVPEFDRAAADAVRQWVYEPLVIEGKAKKVVFTVTVKFALDKDKAKGVAGGVEGGVKGGVAGGVWKEEMERKLKEFEKGAVPCKDDIQPPKLIKVVDPVYPEEARKQGIEGIVILSAKTDEDGKVIDAMLLRSVPGLDEAAIAAVKQWIYEPLILEGKAVKALFTVTVRFKLK